MMDLEGRRAQLTRSETKGINAERTSNSSTLSLRETSSSDSWFMLSLLYNLPFVSDLAYASVMELLEVSDGDRAIVVCNGTKLLVNYSTLPS